MKRTVMLGLATLAGCGDEGAATDAAVADAAVADALAHDGASTATADAGAVDCAALPAPPFAYRVLEDFHPVEDLAFDRDGNMLWSDGQHLMASRRDGEVAIRSVGLRANWAIRMLPDGDVVAATASAIVRVDPDGDATLLLGNLQYPNGIDVGLDGAVYVTELFGGRVLRIEPDSGAWSSLMDYPFVNGISFAADYGALYLSAVKGGATIHRLPIDADGKPGELGVFTDALDAVGSGTVDGLGVDICGNVYVADLEAGKIFRVAPDGATVETVVDRSAEQSSMTAIQWGSGVGGWAADKLYVPDIGVGTIEIDLGVPEKPRAATP